MKVLFGQRMLDLSRLDRRLDLRLRVAQYRGRFRVVAGALAEVSNHLNLANYLTTFKLVDEQSQTVPVGQATQMIAEALAAALEENREADLAQTVRVSLERGRDFTIGFSLRSERTGFYLCPLLNNVAQTNVMRELTFHLQQRGVMVLSPRAERAAPVAKGVAAEEGEVLELANVVGFLAARLDIRLQSQYLAPSAAKWGISYMASINSKGVVNARQVLDMVEMFVSVNPATLETGGNAAALEAADRGAASPVFTLQSRGEVLGLCQGLGLGRVFLDKEEICDNFWRQNPDSEVPHDEHIKPVGYLPSIRDFLFKNKAYVAPLLQKNPQYTEKQAQADIQAAFDMGVQGELL